MWSQSPSSPTATVWQSQSVACGKEDHGACQAGCPLGLLLNHVHIPPHKRSP